MQSHLGPHPQAAPPERHYVFRQQGRYYRLSVQQDLFGVWCLVRVWGGIGTARGQLRSEPQPDARSCADALERAHQRRLQRNYELSTGTSGG